MQKLPFLNCLVLLFLLGILRVPVLKAEEPEPAESNAVPVAVVKLQKTNPAKEQRLTGAVRAWKQEDIGFQVSGRLSWVVDTGAEVWPSDLVSDNNKRRAVIAELDAAPYQRKLERIKSSLAAQEAQVQSLAVSIDEVLPRRKEEAEAERDLAEKQLSRVKGLVKKGAAPGSQLDEAEADFRKAQARVAAVSARINARKAEKRGLQSQIAENRQRLSQARADLEDCTLRAPFPGRIAEVHVIPGGFVQPGEPVVEMVVMDPVKIELAVSAETDRNIQYGDEMKVFPPDWPETVSGTVFRKATRADPETRTFSVTVLMRNFKIAVDLSRREHLRRILYDPAVNVSKVNNSFGALFTDKDFRKKILSRKADDKRLNNQIVNAIVSDMKKQTNLEKELQNLPAVEDVWPLQRRDAGDQAGEPSYIAQDALYGDGNGGWFTWLVTNLKYGEPHKSLLKLRRVSVTPTEQTLSLLGLFRFRKLKDMGPLTSRSLVAAGVPSTVSSKESVASFIRKRWLFKPGQILPVDFDTPGLGSGFYVPASALLMREDENYIFVVEEKGSESVAVRVPVQSEGRHGEQVRITGDKVEIGDVLVVHGQHYLMDGQLVNVVDLF